MTSEVHGGLWKPQSASAQPPTVWSVRSQDMQPGQDYYLDGGRERVVTVLETPPEVRSQAKVRVRFRNGVKAGEEALVPSRRIVAPLHGRESRAPRRQRARVIRFDGPAHPGDEALWRQTGDIVWTVESVTGDAATVTGQLFGKPVSKTVPMSELEVRPLVILPGSDAPIVVRDRRPQDRADIDCATSREQFAPERPRRELDLLLDDVLFSPACLDGYRRSFARGMHGPGLAERLREEIRTRGYVVLGGAPGSGEYARLRVAHRFDVILLRKPSPEDPIKIERLWYPPKRGAARKHGQQSQPKRRKPQAST